MKIFEESGRKKEKRITDSNLSLISLKGISKRYHLECQSTPDGTMEIRMWEYDAQVALMEKRIQGRRATCEIPGFGSDLFKKQQDNTG